jgi:hypothetical protein
MIMRNAVTFPLTGTESQTLALNLDAPLGSPDTLLMGEGKTRQNEAHSLILAGVLENKGTNASDLEVDSDRASVDRTLEEALQVAQEFLRNFATDSKFLPKMRLARFLRWCPCCGLMSSRAVRLSVPCVVWAAGGLSRFSVRLSLALVPRFGCV